MQNRKSSIRGWVSAISCMLMVTMTVLPVSLLSIFMRPICENLGASAASFSLLFSLSSGGAMVTSLFFGKIFKRCGKKLLIVIGGITNGIFLLTAAFTSNITTMHIAIFISGFGACTSGFAMAQVTITEWFDKNRAIMFCMLTVVLSLISSVASPILARLTNQYGYRSVLIGEAIICGVGVVLLGLLCISDAPEKYGLKPIGYREIPADQSVQRAQDGRPLAMKTAMKTAPFWMIMTICFIASCTGRIEQSQASNFYQTLGLDSVQASYAISVNSMAALGWSLLYGIMADKFTPKIATIISGSCAALVFISSPMLSGMAGAMVFALFIEGESGVASTYSPTMVTRLFGKAEAASMIGVVRFIAALGSMVGPVLAGRLYDIFGNYNLCFIVAGCLMALIVVLAVFADSKKNIQNIDAIKKAELCSMQM